MSRSIKTPMWIVIGAMAVVAILAGNRLAPGERAEGPPIVLGSDAVLLQWPDEPSSPYLLRRLAVAAQGLAGKYDPFWLVVHPDPPHHVEGLAFDSWEAADRHRELYAEFHEVYGPFGAPVDDFGLKRIEYDCHTSWTEDCDDPEREFDPGARFDTLVIEWWREGEVVDSRRYGAGKIDAAVFSELAYDRFFYPFFWYEHGPEVADSMRDEALGGGER